MKQHSSLGEGVRLGLVVATTIWIWLAAIDAIVGQPFHTFSVLGGIAQFTLLHYLLNLTYGIAIVWALHRAAREPSLVMGVAFRLLHARVRIRDADHPAVPPRPGPAGLGADPRRQPAGRGGGLRPAVADSSRGSGVAEGRGTSKRLTARGRREPGGPNGCIIE